MRSKLLNVAKHARKNPRRLHPFTRSRIFVGGAVALLILGSAGGWYLSAGRTNLETQPQRQHEESQKPHAQRTKAIPADRHPGETKTNITYCSGQQLDLYEPRTLRHKRSPVVMYLHGGGWVMNDKASEPDQLAMIDGLRDQGYTIVAINYRKIPEAYYPTAVEDTLCAVRYLRAHAEHYFIDKHKVALYGFSAGGYLAAMAGAVPDNSPFETREYAKESSRVDAVVTLAGLFDFTDGLTNGNQERIAHFLAGADPGSTDVVAHISRDDPPYLLLHGAEDQAVPVAQDEIFAAELQKKNVPVKRQVVAFAEHGLNPSGGEPQPSREEVKRMMAEFFRSHMEKSAR